MLLSFIGCGSESEKETCSRPTKQLRAHLIQNDCHYSVNDQFIVPAGKLIVPSGCILQNSGGSECSEFIKVDCGENGSGVSEIDWSEKSVKLFIHDLGNFCTVVYELR